MSSRPVTDSGARSLPRSSAAELSDIRQTSLPDAIDRLADGYYEMDASFCYRRINPAGLRIAGKTLAEMLGKHVSEVFPDIEREGIHQTTVEVMRSRQPQSVETYYPPHRRW